MVRRPGSSVSIQRTPGTGLWRDDRQTHAEFVELLRQSRRNRTEATKRELQFAQADRPHTYETIISCVQTDDKVSGVVAVLHDITREKEVSQMRMIREPRLARVEDAAGLDLGLFGDAR